MKERYEINRIYIKVTKPYLKRNWLMKLILDEKKLAHLKMDQLPSWIELISDMSFTLSAVTPKEVKKPMAPATCSTTPTYRGRWDAFKETGDSLCQVYPTTKMGPVLSIAWDSTAWRLVSSSNRSTSTLILTSISRRTWTCSFWPSASINTLEYD